MRVFIENRRIASFGIYPDLITKSTKGFYEGLLSL